MVASHVKKFIPSPTEMYIKESDTKAWCKPAYDKSMLSMEQVSFLLTHCLTREEWDDTFRCFGQDQIPEWIKTTGGEKLWAQVQIESDFSMEPDLGLTSPRLTDSDPDGLFQLIPSLSYDSVEVNQTASVEDALNQTVEMVNSRFGKIKSKWSTAFSEIEASYLVVIKDIKLLQHHLATVVASVGTSIEASQGSSVWERLHELTTYLSSSTHKVDVFMESTKGNLDRITHKCDDLQAALQFSENEALLNQTTTVDRLGAMERQLTAFEARFARLLPLLQSLMKHSPSSSNPDPDASFRDAFKELQQRVDTLTKRLLNYPVLGSEDLNSQVVSLQAQIKLLQQRIVGEGVQIGFKVFQSFDDLRAWVSLKLPSKRYGLFVDAVSLLDFFTSVGHVDAEQTFTSYYSQKRTGFASMYEARVAASVQNLFPMVFGKSDSSGLDTSEKLPALSDPDKWDNGATGLKYQILRSMSDVEYQLESAIDSVLGDFDEARQIAKECLFRSKRFIIDLSNFMSQDYHKWTFRGHSKADAWKMTAVSVRRIFEEMHSERVIARDGYDQEDQEYSASKFLWATFKAHSVMAKYLKHQFYEHPAIAAVLARYLADNYVKPDAQDARIKELEKTIKSLTSKVDQLISREAEAKRRDKHDKPDKQQGKTDKEKGAPKNERGRQSPQVPP